MCIRDRAAIHRILFNNGEGPRTLLELIQEQNIAQGIGPALRADMRFGIGPESEVFLLNKSDGTIRVVVQ